MNTSTGQLINIRLDGRCAGMANDKSLVLAQSLPPGHDEGFERSRQLARSFCEMAMDAATNVELDREQLARLSKTLLGSAPWLEWYLSFCIVQVFRDKVVAFNCGTTGALQTVRSGTYPILAPQTLAARLRCQGITAIPPHVETIAATLASEKLEPVEIDMAFVDINERQRIVAVADPRIFDAMLIDASDRSSRENVTERIAHISGSLNNPESSFAALVC